ncbi:hypothetical protein K0M31_015499 [Melipona bicolor]|uniref:Uncharacterized protein n=1 Tax=Melipona bicolor TaxID=60889 RepID=A0AA40KF48_9HYME|nr:hypothetical protein K0M31_015499 [Melipona bicolor]
MTVIEVSDETDIPYRYDSNMVSVRIDTYRSGRMADVRDHTERRPEPPLSVGDSGYAVCLVGVCGRAAWCGAAAREMPGSEGVRGAFGRTAGWWFCGCESLYRKNQPQWKLKPLRSLTHHAHSPARR